MDSKKLKSLDDIRAVLNDPEVQAADKELSKKRLNANHSRGLAEVLLFISASLLIISLSSRKASSVAPVVLGRADAVYVFSVSLSSEANDHALAARRREALLDLLGQLKVQRSEKNSDEFLMASHLFFPLSVTTPTAGLPWLRPDICTR